MRLLLCTLILCGSFQPVAANEFTLNDLIVTSPLASATRPTANAAAGYMVITNNGAAPDRLVAVEAPFRRIEIHTVIRENDVAKMVPLDGIEIAPGESITLAPGKEHVMFMGLGGDPLEVGETVPATLMFENAGALALTFDVQPRDAIVAQFSQGEHDDTESHNH